MAMNLFQLVWLYGNVPAKRITRDLQDKQIRYTTHVNKYLFYRIWIIPVTSFFIVRVRNQLL